MRSTAVRPTPAAPLSPRAETGTTRRSTTPEARTAGVSRPSLRDVPGRDKKSGGTRAGIGTGGWAGYKKAKTDRSVQYPRFEVDKTGPGQLIKFAEAEPFAFIYRHWVSKRPYTCIADTDNDVVCPLCDAGDPAKPVVFYNILDVSDVTLKVWEMTADPTRKVQKHYDQLAELDDPKTLDDPGFYFAVSKSQKDRSAWEYEVTRVKSRDLAEDWGTDPLGDDEIADATKKGLFTDSIIYVSSRDDLREAVGKIED
jgi:hypothetical protein